jgi:HK97 family phage major capsid protein
MTEIKQLVDMTKEVQEVVLAKNAEFERKLGQLEAAMTRPDFGNGVADVRGEEAKAIDAWARSGNLEEKALSITSDGQGVVVRGDWSNRIFTLVRETSPVRQVANVMSTSTQSLEVLVDRGEPGSAWVAETGTRSATTESFLTRHPISVHEHYAYPSVTNHLLGDADFDVEGWLQGKIGARFGRQEADGFINGDGVGQPRGILNYSRVPNDSFTWGSNPASYEIGAIYTGADGTLGTTQTDVLSDLVDSLKADYLPGAGFMMTRAMRNLIRKLKDGDGKQLFQPSLEAAIPDRLMGYPIYLAEDMPALAPDAVGILFGNFREAYTVVDRTGIQVIRDPYTQPGFVKYYVSKRVGGALTNPEAIKALVLGSEPV